MTRSRTAVFILSLAVFFACTVYIGWYFYSDFKVENDVSSLRRVVHEAEEDQENQGGDAEDMPEYAPNGMLSAYYELAQKNEDMIGWVKIEGTKVDYPVMYSNKDNEYYLHKNFEKEYSANGLPYLDYQCDLQRPSTNLIIYGHHMRSGSMFASLTKYKNKEYFNEHPTVRFDTLYTRMEYEIFAVCTTVVGKNGEFRYHEFINAEDENDFNEFMEQVKANSCYDTGKTASFGDQLLTLSTCSYDVKNQRTVVFARRIR